MEEPETSRTATLLDTIWSDDDLIECMRAFRAIVARRNRAAQELAVEEEHLADAVRGMRFRQASWATIAVALTTSKQAAQQRYGEAV